MVAGHGKVERQVVNMGTKIRKYDKTQEWGFSTSRLRRVPVKTSRYLAICRVPPAAQRKSPAIAVGSSSLASGPWACLTTLSSKAIEVVQSHLFSGQRVF